MLGRDGDAARLVSLPVELVNAFEDEYVSRWPGRVDPRIFDDAVLAATLARIRSDAAVYAAAKAVRRIVGFSKVADVETLPEPERVVCVRLVLRAARVLGTARLEDAAPARLAALTSDVLFS